MRIITRNHVTDEFMFSLSFVVVFRTWANVAIVDCVMLPLKSPINQKPTQNQRNKGDNNRLDAQYWLDVLRSRSEAKINLEWAEVLLQPMQCSGNIQSPFILPPILTSLMPGIDDELVLIHLAMDLLHMLTIMSAKVHHLLVHMKASAHSRYTKDYNKLMSNNNHDNRLWLYDTIFLYAIPNMKSLSRGSIVTFEMLP